MNGQDIFDSFGYDCDEIGDAGAGWTPGHREYDVTLWRGDEEMHVAFHFTPSAHGRGPAKDDVLQCVVDDAYDIVVNGCSFEDFCEEYGCDGNRRDEETYDACTSEGDDIMRLLDGDVGAFMALSDYLSEQ